MPEHFPARAVLIYLSAGISLVAGIGLLRQRTALTASRLLLGPFLLWLLFVRLPAVFSAPASTDGWWSLGDTAVMAAATWVLYVWFAGDRDRQRLRFATGDNGLRIARVLCGMAYIPFGVAHFTYLDHTVSLVPAWLPWRMAWACITGGAFIVAGMAMIIGVCARLAAVLSAFQLGVFTLLVWVPVIVTGADASQWTEFVSSWTLTAGAWLVADSYGGTSWLGIGTR